MDEEKKKLTWDDVHDPTYEFEFVLDWDYINKAYHPADIQTMIEEDGMRDMIRIVNEYMYDTYGKRALYLSHYKGHKTIINK